jgi:GT2 family glycosyltransferase/uncharacterized membrane protein YbhN (UPF0104 family)
VELSFTVIIPARNAAPVLGKCLSSMVSKGADRSPLEVIVVDDGSTDDTAAVAASHGARVLHLTGLGPAAARNAGARAASGDLLVFVDADCSAEQGCFEALLAPFADPAVAGSRGGYTSAQEALLARFVQLEMDEKQARLEESGLVTLLDTACAAYRRTLFMEQGGFDEGLPATSVEDAELSFRLTAQGYHLVYAPSARVRHRHPEQLGNYLWRKLRFGYYRALLYRRYPARVRNDGYTPRLMPLQILLAGIVMATGILGFWSAAARTLAAAAALLSLLVSLPLARRAWSSDRRLAMATPILLLLRSCAQGLGLLAGLAQLVKGSRSTRWAGGVLTLASLATLGLLVSRSDWQQLIRPLADARPEWLIAAIVLAFAVEVAKTVRWQLLLGLSFGDLPRLLALVFTARLLNILAPLRAGDLWRVASATASEGQPVLIAGGSVVAEKVLDGVALAAGGILLIWLPGHDEGWILLPSLALIALVTLAIGLGARMGSRTRFARWTAGTGHLKDPRLLVSMMALTVVGLGLGLAVNLAVLRALDLPAGTAIILTVLVSGYAAGLLPAGPGQLGVFELALSAPLMARGFPPTSAVAAALTLHLVMLTMLLLGGALSMPVSLRYRTGRRAAGERH